MKYTEEQEKVIDYLEKEGKGLIVNAYAGSGKTSTLVGIAKAYPESRFLYLAFNRAVKNDAEKKFPSNCQIYTLHGMAYQYFAMEHWGAKLNTKLQFRWSNKDYILNLGIRGHGNISASKMAFIARTMVRRFKNSAEDKVGREHIDPEHISDVSMVPGAQTKAIQLANELWELEKTPASEVPITHDTYLKLFQLEGKVPEICDVLLLDEAQDTNPVTEAIVQKFNSEIILVGDSFQAIYQWRGSVNAIKRFEDIYEQLWLTKSFRFGEVIAKLATDIIQTISDKPIPKLEGNSDIASEIGPLDYTKQYTILFRTNGALAKHALSMIEEGKKVYVEGGVKELCDNLTDLYALSLGAQKVAGSAKYSPFKTYQEVKDEAPHDVEVQKDLKFIDTFGARTPMLIQKLKDSVKDKRSLKTCDVIMSTAHKSKGLEWPQVRLFTDYRFETKSDAEWNLFYVAVTRAINKLQLPPEFYAGLQYYKSQKIQSYDWDLGQLNNSAQEVVDPTQGQ